MSQPIALGAPSTARLAAWQNVASWIGAILVAALFLLAGVWKMSDPIEAGARLAQARVPGFLSEYAAVGFGVAETFSAILILIPRFRKLGAWLTGLMLIAFMVWVGYFYNELVGKECSCFPWIKRAVGPGFFIGDAAMLAFAVVAGWWAKFPLQLDALKLEWKQPAILAAVLLVLGGANYGYALSKLTGAQAPASITLADGTTHELREGRQIIYFFDPQCMHCFQAAKQMAQLNFGETKVIGAATEVPQFAQGFLTDTGFKAKMAKDALALKKVFPFGDPPYLVLLENGRQKAGINKFDEPMPSSQLLEMGYATKP